MSPSARILTLLFASTNKGKLAEVRLVASRLNAKIVSAEEVAAPGRGQPPEVVEDRDTYEGNARLKADAFYAWSGIPSLADDAGLEIEALGGKPGVWSARYAGEPANSQKNIEKMLTELQGHTNRRARFVSFLFARLAPDVHLTAQEFLTGNILSGQRGAGGFGYDSIFVPDGHSITLSEIKEDVRAAQTFKTHRIMALEKILPEINRVLTAGVLRTAR